MLRTGEKPKVLYVLGAHRSGSTVLGVTLGNCADVFFAGELHSWLTRRGVPSFGGEEGSRLWREIADDVEGGEALYGHETQLYVDRSSALYRVHKWPRRRQLRKPYRRVSENLYRAIARATGATHIVDTSHYPLRAMELQALDGIELYLLWLVRDPQGVVASQDPRRTEGYAKSALTTNFQLWATHLLALLAFLRQPRARRMFVRHEDFLADPEGVVRQILEQTDSAAETPDFGALTTGSPLQGNRFLKKSDVIALKAPTLPPPAHFSRMTSVLQRPWEVVFSRLQPALRPSVARRETPDKQPR